MPRIFISYRREDTRAFTGRIHDRLETIFGDDNIFKDVDDIPPGADFRRVLQQAIDECDVVLVIIGKNWLTVTDTNGRRRLDAEADFVRFEVETAMSQETIRVVPVLVDGASMPQPDDLPQSIRGLAYRNAVVIRHDPDFRRDVERLAEQLKRLTVGQISGVRSLQRGEPDAMTSKVHVESHDNRTTVQFPTRWVIAAVVLFIVVLVGLWIAGNSPDDAGTDTLTAAQTDIAVGSAPLGWQVGDQLYVIDDAAAIVHDPEQPATGDNLVVDLAVGDTVTIHTDPNSELHYSLDTYTREVWLVVWLPDDEDTLGLIQVRYLDDERG